MWHWYSMLVDSATHCLTTCDKSPTSQLCNTAMSSHPNRVLPPENLSIHASPCMLHYMNRRHLTNCSAKYQQISSASLVSWLLKCAEQIIQKVATNCKISLKESFHFILFPITSIDSSNHVNILHFMDILESHLASCLASAEEIFEHLKCTIYQ